MHLHFCNRSDGAEALAPCKTHPAGLTPVTPCLRSPLPWVRPPLRSYAKALATFEQALDLPGTGTKRWRDKPRLPSDGERMAVLYNTACCYAQLQDARNGLLALASERADALQHCLASALRMHKPSAVRA